MAGKGDSIKTGIPSLAFPYTHSELLEKGLAALGFETEETTGIGPARVRGIPSIISLVTLYLKELVLFNAVFDLVGAETNSEQGLCDLVVRHILDSLAPWKEIATALTEPGAAEKTGSARLHVADAGSGAGFPGIPLAIIFPEIQFTLIERMSRRCSFLENCAAILGLKNVLVVNSEVEKAERHSFDLVVFRAFRPLDRTMIRTLLALTRSGGMLAAYKAKREKIIEEMAAVEAEVSGWKMIRLFVPFLEHEERHLVLTASETSPNRPS